jgi:hypothetical protein
MGRTRRAATTLLLDEDRPICQRCGRGKLDLIDERPHPILGIAGVTCRTLRCDAVDCGALATTVGHLQPTEAGAETRLDADNRKRCKEGQPRLAATPSLAKANATLSAKEKPRH